MSASAPSTSARIILAVVAVGVGEHLLGRLEVARRAAGSSRDRGDDRLELLVAPGDVRVPASGRRSASGSARRASTSSNSRSRSAKPLQHRRPRLRRASTSARSVATRRRRRRHAARRDAARRGGAGAAGRPGGRRARARRARGGRSGVERERGRRRRRAPGRGRRRPSRRRRPAAPVVVRAERDGDGRVRAGSARGTAGGAARSSAQPTRPGSATRRGAQPPLGRQLVERVARRRGPAVLAHDVAHRGRAPRSAAGRRGPARSSRGRRGRRPPRARVVDRRAGRRAVDHPGHLEARAPRRARRRARRPPRGRRRRAARRASGADGGGAGVGERAPARPATGAVPVDRQHRRAASANSAARRASTPASRVVDEDVQRRSTPLPVGPRPGRGPSARDRVGVERAPRPRSPSTQRRRRPGTRAGSRRRRRRSRATRARELGGAGGAGRRQPRRPSGRWLGG